MIKKERWVLRKVKDLNVGDLIINPTNEAGERVTKIDLAGPSGLLLTTGFERRGLPSTVLGNERYLTLDDE